MTEEEDTITKKKIVLIGGPSVGKTSIINKYVDSNSSTSTNPTIQLAFSTKIVTFGDMTIKLQMCDTAGQERFQSVAPNFYRSSDAAIIVFDVTETNSFLKVKDWLDELNAVMPESFIVIVVGNKCDLEKERTVSYAMATDYARKNDVHYMEASALTGNGVDNVFLYLVEKFVEAMQQHPSFVEQPACLAQPLDTDEEKIEKKKKCC